MKSMLQNACQCGIAIAILCSAHASARTTDDFKTVPVESFAASEQTFEIAASRFGGTSVAKTIGPPLPPNRALTPIFNGAVKGPPPPPGGGASGGGKTGAPTPIFKPSWAGPSPAGAGAGAKPPPPRLPSASSGGPPQPPRGLTPTFNQAVKK